MFNEKFEIRERSYVTETEQQQQNTTELLFVDTLQSAMEIEQQQQNTTELLFVDTPQSARGDSTE